MPKYDPIRRARRLLAQATGLAEGVLSALDEIEESIRAAVARGTADTGNRLQLIREFKRSVRALVGPVEDCDYELAKIEARIRNERARLRAEIDELRDLLIGMAERGAQTLELEPQANGSGFASVDLGRPTRLSQTLFAFLRILASEGGCDEDGFAAWKSHEDVKRALRETTDPTNLVWRLREAFILSKINPALVQTRNNQLRFAIAPENVTIRRRP